MNVREYSLGPSSCTVGYVLMNTEILSSNFYSTMHIIVLPWREQQTICGVIKWDYICEYINCQDNYQENYQEKLRKLKFMIFIISYFID